MVINVYFNHLFHLRMSLQSNTNYNICEDLLILIKLQFTKKLLRSTWMYLVEKLSILISFILNLISKIAQKYSQLLKFIPKRQNKGLVKLPTYLCKSAQVVYYLYFNNLTGQFLRWCSDWNVARLYRYSWAKISVVFT